MSLLACRWPNGDVSIVTERQALVLLDEVCDPGAVQVFPLDEFAVHFTLNDTGEMELESFNGDFESDTMEKLYPVLEARRAAIYENGEQPDADNMKAALKKETNRKIKANILKYFEIK